MPEKIVLAAELTFDEMLRARQVWLLHTDEYITTPFELRTILSELGQYPQDAELNFCVEAFGNKMAFNNFTTYLGFLKKRFQKPEPQDVDTLRAFVALGGGSDRRGDINAENLRNACRHFDLTIDIDAMIREVDDDMSGKLEFSEFKSMWADGGGGAAAAAAEAASGGRRGKDGDSFDMDVDEHIFSGTLRRSGSTVQAAGVTSPQPPPQKDDDAPEEDQIELLKQHLFPLDVNNRKSAEGARKSVAKRTSMLVSSRFGGVPNAPLRETAGGAGGAAAGITAVSALAGRTTDAHNGGDGSDSDDNGDTAQHTSYKGQYKPPSPVILSLRHAKPPSKIRSGGRSGSNTPRRGGNRATIRSSTTPRASPRR